MLIRRQAFDAVGPFGGAGVGACIDCYARAVDHGLRMKMLSEIVFERRIHTNQHGTNR